MSFSRTPFLATPKPRKSHFPIDETIGTLIKNVTPRAIRTARTSRTTKTQRPQTSCKPNELNAPLGSYDIPKEKMSLKQLMLTEENLRKHNEQIKLMNPKTLHQRIIEWLNNIPLILQDPDKIDSPEEVQENKRSYRSASHLNRTEKRQLPNLKPSTSVNSSFFVQPWKPNERLRTKNFLPAAIKKERGKLICCLKVEVRTGVYQMLPIHKVFVFNKGDDPQDLANDFCKANNLLGSLGSLKRHIMNSIKTFG